MVWTGVSSFGKTKIKFTSSNLNSAGYINIVNESLQELLEANAEAHEMIFQQDNAPIHKSKMTTGFFRAQRFSTLDWPARSPDLPPIENI